VRWGAPAVSSHAPIVATRRSISSMPHSTPTCTTKRSPMRRVGRELRRLGVQRRIVSHPRAKTGWDSLTDSELKVVNLIAQGATNRSVAQRLHVTPHTVKAHLHNAFAKLGINSRAELSKLMHSTDQSFGHARRRGAQK
jgi:DNA-binding CsgD family transcriptional regulator